MEFSLGSIAEAVGVAVFALTGALVAARKGMDPFGFILLATVTGVGGGSLRDMLLGQPAFWVSNPRDVVVCIAVGLAAYGLGSRVPGLMASLRPGRLLLWADALGLAIFCVTGAGKALATGAHPVTAAVLGALTASFGGIIRDLLAGEVPLVLHREIYVTAAFVGAAIYVAGRALGVPPDPIGFVAMGAAFGLRGLALSRDWSLPAFTARAK